MSSESNGSSPKLSELPGELILEILQYLTVTRGYLSSPEDETLRQTENAQRISALHGMTLMCRRLNSIATPFLYESITKLGRSEDWSNVDSLLNTLKRKPQLVKFVRYIETDGTNQDDEFGRYLVSKFDSLSSINYDLPDPWGFRTSWSPCGIIISTLIQLAHNLQHLAIDHTWHHTVVYDLYSNLALRDVSLRDISNHGTMVHISGSSGVRFSPAILLLSHACGQIQAGGIKLEAAWGPYDPFDSRPINSHGPPGDFGGAPVQQEELQSVVIDNLDLEGNINGSDLRVLLRGSTVLRRLRCRWTSGINGSLGEKIDLPKLRIFLQRFGETLESLVLDTLDSSWLVELDEDIPTIGSLREFTNLKHIEVSGMVLWSDDDSSIKQPQLSSMLPPALETLVVNVEWDDDVEEALADLAKSRTTHFPNLKKIDCCWRPAPMFVGRDLIAEFARDGVELKLDIASCTEEEEERIDADLKRMEQETEHMDKRAEALAEEMRQFDEEMTRLAETA